MSKTRSKNILGIFAVLIMLHHLGQKVSAAWVPSAFRRHGLEPFVPIGYLLVAFFFFVSGYGLIKSARSKDDYFKGFLKRRMNRLLMVFVLTNIIWGAVRIVYSNMYLPTNPYSWYVYTIVVMYFGFFFTYRRERKISFLLMTAWLLGYIIVCYILIKGNWWYNSIPTFLLGIYVADHEEKAVDKKTLKLILCAAILLLGFIVSENIGSIYQALNIKDYGIVNFACVVLQMLASSAFSFIVYLLLAGKPALKNQNEGADSESSVKSIEEDMEKDKEKSQSDKKKNKEEVQSDNKGVKGLAQKVLAFYGGMTLEFYLLHGIYVQVFGHHFIDDKTKPVCYIENVLVYTLVTFVLATATAFAIKKAGDFIIYFYGRSPMFQKIFTDFKRYVIILAAIFMVITIGYSIHRHRLSDDSSDKVEKYKTEYIKNVNVRGTDVSVYTAGEGEYTAVLLGSDEDPCSTMYLRPLADCLEKKNIKVVIIDYPGKGFSKDMDGERTTEFFADYIHDTLDALGENENLILIPNQISAIYAYRYIEKYPDTVAGLVAVDGAVPELATRFLDGNFSSVYEYKWYLKRITRLNAISQKLLKATGYISFQTPLYDYMFYGSGLKEYYKAMEEMYIRNTLNEPHQNEYINIYDNCNAVSGYTLPQDLPAEFLLDNTLKENKYYGITWVNQYNRMITNDEIQEITVIAGDPNVIYYNPSIIAKQVEDFITEQLAN
ncbi:Peptidoglycan/LPS O-acetylase OafA/YrhL, contains acyltransferase and SGNH-hydrolase domains [Lachnospiraceae bacterium NE2001]|nr:Peptidoglycan/LPS O-acetylase OafA/YrhL, contains acyltransferase and SGNH-hydrolase domains [Lachnospiraceae bacterium NE2001]